MNEWVWVWVGLAVILAVAEVVQPGWLYLPWAIGAALAAALEFAGVHIWWQWGVFVGVSSVIFVIAQRRIRRSG